MEIIGLIKLSFEKQTFQSGFEKREFVLTTEEQYPQDIKFELYKEKCSLIDSFKTGQKVKVEFNIKGNEYQGKYFVNLNAWRITAEENSQSANNSYVNTPPQISNDDPFSSIDDENSDLPF